MSFAEHNQPNQSNQYQYQPHQPYTPPQPPQKPKRRIGRKLLTIGAPIAALLVGIGMGASTQPTVEVEKRIEVPGPERIVEKRIEVPGPEVEVTPASCIQALDYADDGFGIMTDILTAIQDDDVAALERHNTRLTPLPPKYNAAKEACRNGSI